MPGAWPGSKHVDFDFRPSPGEPRGRGAGKQTGLPPRQEHGQYLKGFGKNPAWMDDGVIDLDDEDAPDPDPHPEADPNPEPLKPQKGILKKTEPSTIAQVDDPVIPATPPPAENDGTGIEEKPSGAKKRILKKTEEGAHTEHSAGTVPEGSGGSGEPGEAIPRSRRDYSEWDEWEAFMRGE